MSDVDVRYFHVSSDNNKVLVSLVEKYEGDIYLSQLA